MEIVILHNMGYSNEEIAKHLGVPSHIVESIIAKVYALYN